MLRATILAAGVLFASQVNAQLVVEEAETTENRVTTNIQNSLFAGELPAGAVRTIHELSVDWGVIHGWKTGLGFDAVHRRGSGDLDLETVEWSNTFAIYGKESLFGAAHGDPSGLDFSIYTSLQANTNTNSDFDLVVGPIVDFTFGGIEFGANLLFDVPVSGGSDTALIYASSAMLRFSPNFAAGLEAHSEIADIFGNTPDFDDQTHFIGPAIEVGFMTGPSQTLRLRLGGFVGLTDASPDFAASLNLSLDIN